MGQKVNPNIFRLGINKKWKTEFFEKKSHELPLYTFKDLEIKSYVERFLETKGIIVHDYKQHYSNSTLNLYISYFVSPEFVINKKDATNKLMLVNASGNVRTVTTAKSVNTARKQNSRLPLFQVESPIEYYNVKKYLKIHPNILQRHSEKSVNFKEEFINLRIEGVLNNLYKVLSLFTTNRFNIIINFCCLNKNLSFLKKTQKKNFILLQKFKGTPFLKEGIELLFYSVYNSNSANLLAKFIAMQVRRVKRHKFFFSFLKQTLTILINSNFSKTKGIKIVIKGRLNGVPRAKHKIITIGDVPVQSISAIIDYAHLTTHNSNGSYGIKVWIVEKNIKSNKNVFTTKKNKVSKNKKRKIKKIRI
jgi:ribosomal protein S3